MRSLVILSLYLVCTLANNSSTIIIYSDVQYTGESITYTSADFKKAADENENIGEKATSDFPPVISSYKLQEGLIATFCYEWSVLQTCTRSCEVVGPVNVPDTLGFKLAWYLIGLKDIDIIENPAVNLFSGEYFIGQSGVFYPGDIFFDQLLNSLGIQVYQPPKPRRRPQPPPVILGALANSIQIPAGVTVHFFKEDNLKGETEAVIGPMYIPVGGIPGLGPTFKSMKIIKDTMTPFKGAWLLAASGTGTIHQTISRGTSNSQGISITKEQATQMTKSVTKSFGFSLFGFSSSKSTTVSNSVANSVGATMSNEFTTNFQYSCTQTCENDDPTAITYMFQWAMNSDRVPQLGDVTSYSCNTLCKKSPEPPKCPLTACLDAECQKCAPWEANPSVSVEHKSEEEQNDYFQEIEDYLRNLWNMTDNQVKESDHSFMQ